MWIFKKEGLPRGQTDYASSTKKVGRSNPRYAERFTGRRQLAVARLTIMSFIGVTHVISCHADFRGQDLRTSYSVIDLIVMALLLACFKHITTNISGGIHQDDGKVSDTHSFQYS